MVIAAIITPSGRRLAQGKIVFEPHQPYIGLLVVLSGATRVYSLDRRGREITIDRQMPGESVPELPLFDGGNYPVGAVAAEPARVFVLPRDRFLALMSVRPQIAVSALRATAIRMRRLLVMLEAQALHTVQARLAACLLRPAACRAACRLEETNDASASSIGTVREVVSRSLRALKEQGAIDLSGRLITIRDARPLTMIADG
ncbi:MAG TPA: Crp/Fnr family transcriptional regulator [Chthonomonadaceae bacterium]|nr:Crp/Fnr family transcriptional regulator [Chthonomonadaceae bacterium]